MTAIHRPPASALKKILPTLDKAAFAGLVRGFLGRRSPEDWMAPVPVSAQLQAYLYEWLLHLGFVTDGQARRLLTESTLGFLTPLAADLEYALEVEPPCPSLPVGLFSVLDRDYAVWPGLTAFYSLLDERYVDRLPSPAVTHIACDLTALFLRKQEWLSKLQEGARDEHQHHAAGGGPAGADPPHADQPGHVRDDPPSVGG